MIVWTLDLNRQSQDLGKQDGNQYSQAAMPVNEVFHFKALSFQLSVSATPQQVPIAPGKLTTANYSSEILRSSLKSLSILPVPSTTLQSGSSAMETGNPVSSRMRLSKFLSSAPPPVSTIPRSLMSAESSGGVLSSATRTAFMIVDTHSLSASRISLSSTVIVFGTPSIRLRPLISMVRGLSSGYAEPISIFICSAVRSPTSRLYFRFR